MTRKEELEIIRSETIKELYAIEHEEDRKRNTQLIGKCFKYKNRYDANESWWLYFQVTRVDEDGELRGIKFETRLYGETCINLDDDACGGLSASWEEISITELRKAWHILLDVLGKADV